MRLQTKPNQTTSKGGFSIGVTCPGCGSRLKLDENFFVLTCRHCDSVLKVRMPDMPMAFLAQPKISRTEIRFVADRYLKKAGLPMTESGVDIKGVYYPYWKADGVLFRVRNQVVERYIHVDQEADKEIKYEQQIKDIRLSPHSVTVLACNENEAIPHNLGMRTDYIDLLPYSDENIPDDFISRPILRTKEEVLTEIQSGVDGLGAISPAAFGKNHTRLFHPHFSLIYFPYFLVESISGDKTRLLIVDGVSNKVVKLVDDYESGSLYSDSAFRNVDFGELSVDFHRCRNCGEDLPEKQSYLYICSNCNVINTLANNNLLADEVLSVNGYESGRDIMIPFWSFKIPAAEASAVRGLFGGIYHSDRLVIPAFRVKNFEAVYKLAKRMSAASARIDLVPVDQFSPQFESVGLSMTEALTLAEIIIYRAMVARNDSVTPDNTEFNPLDVSLIYIPFQPQSYYYVDTVLGAITFEKALLG